MLYFLTCAGTSFLFFTLPHLSFTFSLTLVLTHYFKYSTSGIRGQAIVQYILQYAPWYSHDWASCQSPTAGVLTIQMQPTTVYSSAGLWSQQWWDGSLLLLFVTERERTAVAKIIFMNSSADKIKIQSSALMKRGPLCTSLCFEQHINRKESF